MKKSIYEIYRKQLDKFSETVRSAEERDEDLRDLSLTSTEEGLYFTSRTINKYGACVAYFVPGPIWTVHQKAVALRNGPGLGRIFDQAMKTGRLAEKEIVETNIGKCAKLTKAGGSVAYVRSSILRSFPSDALLYVSGPVEPVVVMIERNCQFYLLGLVMPMRPSDVKVCA